MTITIDLTPEQEALLNERAMRAGQEAGAYLLNAALRETSREEWEKKLKSLAIQTGVSLSNDAVSSAGLYEEHN